MESQVWIDRNTQKQSIIVKNLYGITTLNTLALMQYVLFMPIFL